MTLSQPHNVAALPITSKSGQRIYPRIEMPLVVEIQNEQYTVTDWSLGGFGLSGETLQCEDGDIFKCRLIFAFPYFKTTMDVSAKVVRIENGHARGFQFIDMTTDRAEVLSYIVDNHLSGEMVALPEMLDRGEPGKVVFSTKTTQRLQMAYASLRLAAILLASLVVLAIGSTTILKSFLTVRSEFASVASSRTLARAPVSGFVKGADFSDGTDITTGDILLTITPPVKPIELTKLEQEIKTTSHRIKLQEQELAEVQEVFSNWEKRLDTDLRASNIQRDLLLKEVDARKRVYDRLLALNKKGVTTSARVDDAEIDLRQAQKNLARETANKERLQQEHYAATQGLYMDGAEKTRSTPSDIRREISASRELLKSKEASLASLKEQFTVRSPCNCTIESQSAKNGEYVESGSVVYSLGNHLNATAEVDALVPVERVRYLGIGTEASVVLANQSTELMGKIKQVNYNPRNTGRTGLPDSLRTLGRFALVTISLPPSERLPLSGLPAIVSMRIPLGKIVFHYTGLDWFIDTAKAASE